jgi:hypothetical protein
MRYSFVKSQHNSLSANSFVQSSSLSLSFKIKNAVGVVGASSRTSATKAFKVPPSQARHVRRARVTFLSSKKNPLDLKSS